MFDICSLANSLALGLLIFVVLYSGRRARNRWKRRDHDRNVSDNPSVRDVDTGIPELLPWELDGTDKDLIRVALLATGIALLFCYLKNRKCKGPECGYDQPLSQEGFEFDIYENGENAPWGRRMGSDVTSPLRPSELTQMSDFVDMLRNSKDMPLEDFALINRPGVAIETGFDNPPPYSQGERYLVTPPFKNMRWR
jgi:hypothetical protein